MRLLQFETAVEYEEAALDFLAAHEGRNSLPLGICSTLIASPGRYQTQAYLAIVEDEGRVVAATVWTPPHNVVLAWTERPDAVELIAEHIHRDGLQPLGVLGPTPTSLVFAEAWRRLTGQEFELEKAQRAFQLESVVPVEHVPGRLRRATPDDLDLVLEWSVAFEHEVFGESDETRLARVVPERLAEQTETSGMWIWEDGVSAALAGCGGLTPNGVRIGPVYTPPELRRRGYASACTAALTSHLLRAGRRYCFLFTDLANPTSNHIYQEIGYRPVCDVDMYQFNRR